MHLFGRTNVLNNILKLLIKKSTTDEKKSYFNKNNITTCNQIFKGKQTIHFH